MTTKLLGGRDDDKKEERTGKERQKTSAKNSHSRGGIQRYLPTFGWRRTSQEGESGEGPGAETEIRNQWSRDATEISNRVEQGNPSWVQL